MFGNIKYAEDKGKLYLKNVKMIRASLPKGGAFAMSVAQPVNEKSPENGKNSSRYTNDSFHHVNIALRDIQAYFISQEKRIIVKKNNEAVENSQRNVPKGIMTSKSTTHISGGTCGATLAGKYIVFCQLCLCVSNQRKEIT